MANNAGTTDKLRKEIQSLELDEIAVDKGVRKGILTLEEGKKRKAEIYTRRGKIDRELQHELNTQRPQDDKKHSDDKHGKKLNISKKQVKNESENVSPSSSSTTATVEAVSEPQTTTTEGSTATPSAPSDTSNNSASTPTSSSQNTAGTPTTPPATISTTYNGPTPDTLPLNTQSTAPSTMSTGSSSTSLAAETTQTTKFSQQPSSIPKRTILKAIGRAATEKIGNVYKYTPLGFLVGQVDLGNKEREFAKATTKSILSAPKTLTNASASAAKTAATTALKYTPGGLLWEHLVPETIKTNIKSALHTNFIKDPPLKIDVTGALKTGGKKPFTGYSKLYKYTPLGLIWKNFIPKTTKDMLENFARHPNSSTKGKLKDFKITTPQIIKDSQKQVGGIAKTVYKNYTPLGLLYKAIPEKKKQDTKTALKSAKDYQKIWNKNIVTNALKKGYDRFGLLQKIRNAKIWKSTAFKYGKYTVSPLGAAMYDRRQYLKKQDQKTQSGQMSSPSKLQTALRGKNPYAEWTSPKSLSNKFWNTAWNRFGTPGAGSVNNALGRKIGNKAGGKAASKIGQQLGKKAAQTIAQTGMRAVLLNPGTLTAIGIVLLILLAVITLLIIIASITGSGDSGKGSGNDDENGEAPIVNPIPGFTLSLTGPPSVNTCQDPTVSDCYVEYSISYTNLQETSLQSITIYNDIPSNTDFVSAGPQAEYDAATRRVSWKLSESSNISPLTIRIKPLQNDIRVSNQVYALTTPAGGGMIIPKSDSLVAAFDAAAKEYNIPSALTRAIAKTESAAHDEYTNTDFTAFNQNGWFSGLSDDAPTKEQLPELILNGYAYNTCAFPKSNPLCPGLDVRGITQFLDTTWDSVKDRIPTVSGEIGDRRYAADAVYGQARHTKDIMERYDAEFEFSKNPTSLTETQVKAIATTYCGGNPYANINVPACGNGEYDDKVWNYYQEIKATQNQ